jgi:hypothetical protein
MRARVLLAALVVMVVGLVFAPSGAATRKCFGNDPPDGPLVRVRPAVLIQEHKLYWGFCLPEH